MEMNDSDKINVLPKYLLVGQHGRTDMLNSRILERSVPDEELAPNFSPRPVITRYSRFPMVDSRMPTNVPIQNNFDYSLEKNFTPPLMKIGPVSGFINNVGIESSLRNQDYALQKGNDKVVYVPSSESDLYKVYVPSAPSSQPHPGLFSRQEYSTRVKECTFSNANIGTDRFHNNTRTQSKILSKKE